MGAVRQVALTKHGFYSRMFLVSNKSGTIHPKMDLS
jgi:hypothetical protein